MPRGGFARQQARPPKPPTALGRLRILSDLAAIRCSPLIFGGISVGTSWDDRQPPTDREKSFRLLDAYVHAGGNTIDTANNYQEEESEQIIGEWLAERQNRDQLIIATKYTSEFVAHKYGKNESANLSGNSRKSLHVSLRASLRKLQTDYVDILYVHWWDWSSSISEMMDSLDIEVKAGRVLYLGASNFPAWVVSACNEYAKAHGKTQFSLVQTKWNALERDIERDTLPMARMYGLAVVAWSVLGAGKFMNEAEVEQAIADGHLSEDAIDVKISRVLSEIAKARGFESFAPVALAYIMAKYPLTFPLIGVQTVEQLHDNIRALDIHLTQDEMQAIEAVRPPHIGFPGVMTGPDPKLTGTPGGVNILQLGTIDWLKEERRHVNQD